MIAVLLTVLVSTFSQDRMAGVTLDTVPVYGGRIVRTTIHHTDTLALRVDTLRTIDTLRIRDTLVITKVQFSYMEGKQAAEYQKLKHLNNDLSVTVNALRDSLDALRDASQKLLDLIASQTTALGIKGTDLHRWLQSVYTHVIAQNKNVALHTNVQPSTERNGAFIEIVEYEINNDRAVRGMWHVNCHDLTVNVPSDVDVIASDMHVAKVYEVKQHPAVAAGIFAYAADTFVGRVIEYVCGTR